jgi:hypothetical protein
MDPDKVMKDPKDIEAVLEAFFLFSIGIGFSPIGGTVSAQGGIKGFQVIGMDLGVLQGLRCQGMLPIRGLIGRPLSAASVGLVPLIFDAHFNTFRQGLGGTSALTVTQEFSANFKQYLTITSFTIGNQSQALSGFDHPDQGTDSTPEELAVFTPTP